MNPMIWEFTKDSQDHLLSPAIPSPRRDDPGVSLRSLAPLRRAFRRSSFEWIDRVEPSRVEAVNVSLSPSYVSPKNFKGLSHTPPRFTHPDFSGEYCMPHSAYWLGHFSMIDVLGKRCHCRVEPPRGNSMKSSAYLTLSLWTFTFLSK